MSQHEELKPNKPALGVLAVAGVLLALSIATMLVVPSLQPKLTPVAISGGGPPPTGGLGRGVKPVMAAMPSGVGINQKLDFTPKNLVVVIGVNNTIIWVNQDSVDHTATSNPGDPAAFDTGDVPGGTSSAPITLTTPGTYGYHCQFHPAWMKGTIVVLPAAEPTS
jgi:plastocyanin